MIDFKSISEIKSLVLSSPNSILEIVNDVVYKLNSIGKTLDAIKYTNSKFSLNQASKLIQEKHGE